MTAKEGAAYTTGVGTGFALAAVSILVFDASIVGFAVLGLVIILFGLLIDRSADDERGRSE